MEDLQINIGMIILDQETQVRFRIIAIQLGQVILCRMNCTQLDLISYSLQILIQQVQHGEWILLPAEEKTVTDHNILTGVLKKTFDTKLAVIRQVEQSFGPTYLRLHSRQSSAEINAICQALSIGKTTFWKTVRLYLQSGFDVNALLDGRISHAANISEYRSKTGRPAQYGIASSLIITPEIKKQFDEGIKIFQSGRSQTLKNAYNYVMETYYSRTEYSESGVAFSLLPLTKRPSFRQFTYYVHKVLSQKDIDIVKTSRQEYRNNQRLLLSDSLHNVYGPGDCVEIDECEIDISLVSSGNHQDTVGRPILYLMIDVYTRAIIAFSVSFENNSTLGLTNCLLNLSDDKTALCQKYGIEASEADWFPGFLPKRIRCDRGAEYRGKQTEQIFQELGITRELVSPATGSLKGIVEHMFRQFHQDINPYTEGVGQIQKRHDSRHHQQAALDIHDFTRLVITFILKHNHSYMSTYPLTKDMCEKQIVPTPMDLWQYGVKTYGNPRPIGNYNQYIYSLMKPVPAKISRAGLTWKNLNYINLLDPYFRTQMECAGRKKEPFDARIDPRDIGFLYYLHKGELKQAKLNPAKTGNADFSGMTMKEYEQFYQEKKAQDKVGLEMNLQMQVAANSIYQGIVSDAKQLSSGPASKENMLDHRRKERFLTNSANALSNRLPNSKAIPLATTNPTPAALPSFEIDFTADDPNDPNYWADADHAAKQEEKLKF